MPDLTNQHASAEALRAAADAYDDASVRRLDLGQTTALIADAVWRLGVAEGRRLATEGWEREWLVNHPPYGGADRFVTEGLAREEAARVGRPVFVRLVGPWEPAEPAAPVSHARGCVCGWNDAGQRFDDPICRRR